MLARAQSAPPKSVAAKGLTAKGPSTPAGAAKKPATTIVAAKRPSAAPSFWRHTTWGLAAVAALGVAALGGSDDGAAQKAAALFASFTPHRCPRCRNSIPKPLRDNWRKGCTPSPTIAIGWRPA
jgi:hypothetical protein